MFTQHPPINHRPYFRRTRDALYVLYGSDLCLVTQTFSYNFVAHIVPRCTKPERLTLYEYCLGCEPNTFHIDSRCNMIYFCPNLHVSFDADEWLLLPELSTLREVKSFVLSVLAARQNSSNSELEEFTSKWNVDFKTTYTFMPLPKIPRHLPILRRTIEQDGHWEATTHPFNSIPPFECHVSPPLAVINGAPKLAGLNLNAIALTYHGQESNKSQVLVTKERLAFVCEIWHLIKGAEGDAKKWEENKRGERKWDQDSDDDDTDQLS